MPDKSFGQLLFIKPQALIHSRATNSTFDYTEIWFTNQSLKPLQTEDDVDIALKISNRP